MTLLKVVALAVLGFAQVCCASTAWDGTWKFDEGASRTIPGPLTVEHFGGTYKIHGDSTLQFRCPDAHSAGPGDSVIHCVDTGPGVSLEIERRGDVTKAIKFQLDSNGRRSSGPCRLQARRTLCLKRRMNINGINLDHR